MDTVIHLQVPHTVEDFLTAEEGLNGVCISLPLILVESKILHKYLKYHDGVHCDACEKFNIYLSRITVSNVNHNFICA